MKLKKKNKVAEQEINKLYNIDCIEGMKLLRDNSIDLIVTDPPYRVTARGNPGNTGGMLKKEIFMSGKVFKENDITPQEYIPEFYRVLKDGAHCYIMSNHINLQQVINVAVENGFKFVKSLIWNKGNKIMGHYYMSQFEYILFFRKGKGICAGNGQIACVGAERSEEMGEAIRFLLNGEPVAVTDADPTMTPSA